MICPKCGGNIPADSNFCPRCGSSITAGSGAPAHQQPQQPYAAPQGGYAYQPYTPNPAGTYNAAASNAYLGALIGKMKASMILCRIAAIFAVIGAAVCLVYAIIASVATPFSGFYVYYAIGLTVGLYSGAGVLTALSILDFIHASKFKGHIVQMRVNPFNIPARFSTSKAVIFLIFNILLSFGLTFGFIGAIFGIVSCRYAKSHAKEFAALEQQYRR